MDLAGSDLESSFRIVCVPRGAFRAGFYKHDPQEAPIHSVTVNGFRIDLVPVVNQKFCRFANEPSRVTLAEFVPPAEAGTVCRIQENPCGTDRDSCGIRQPDIKVPRKVQKGDSHLCAPNSCRRYRSPAPHARPVHTSTNQFGFQCAVRKRRES